MTRYYSAFSVLLFGFSLFAQGPNDQVLDLSSANTILTPSGVEWIPIKLPESAKPFSQEHLLRNVHIYGPAGNELSFNGTHIKLEPAAPGVELYSREMVSYRDFIKGGAPFIIAVLARGHEGPQAYITWVKAWSQLSGTYWTVEAVRKLVQDLMWADGHDSRPDYIAAALSFASIPVLKTQKSPLSFQNMQSSLGAFGATTFLANGNKKQLESRLGFSRQEKHFLAAGAQALGALGLGYVFNVVPGSNSIVGKVAGSLVATATYRFADGADLLTGDTFKDSAKVSFSLAATGFILQTFAKKNSYRLSYASNLYEASTNIMMTGLVKSYGLVGALVPAALTPIIHILAKRRAPHGYARLMGNKIRDGIMLHILVNKAPEWISNFADWLSPPQSFSYRLMEKKR